MNWKNPFAKQPQATQGLTAETPEAKARRLAAEARSKKLLNKVPGMKKLTEALETK